MSQRDLVPQASARAPPSEGKPRAESPPTRRFQPATPPLWEKKRRGKRERNPAAPQLFQLLFLDVLDALPTLLGFLLEASALFEGSEPVLHVLLLVLTHLPSELVGMLEAPRGLFLLLLLLLLNLQSLSPGGRDKKDAIG